MSSTGLRHNRDFLLLAVARTSSKLGGQITAVGLPLLVLALTGSATAAGLVALAEGIALVVVLLPAGLVADRWDRRGIMLVTEAGSLAGLAAIGVLALTGHASVLTVAALAAVVAGLGAALQPAAAAATRAVVADRDLRAATVFNETRNGTLHLAGPPLGGFLFTVNPALPFVVDAITSAVALAAVALLRGPLKRPGAGRSRREGGESLPRQAVAGIRFLWGRPALRYTLISSAVLNFAFSGVLLAILVVPVRDGASGLSAGMIISCVGLGAVIGSLVASWLTARIATRTLILAVFWACGLLTAAMTLTSNGYVLGALAGVSALLVPAANIGMLTTQALLTPDHLQGRANAAISFLAMVVSPFGPAVAGPLIDRASAPVVFGFFAVLMLGLAAATTASPAVRSLPDLRHLDRPEAPGHAAEEVTPQPA
ncbi:MFS transporter [Micromonospora sp. WMMA1923]|uniref:MFS transporter n=1 Tax=Micromonospora sp. WMMA1923 TaxID=3404125 RepID=UPI003B95C967